MEKYTDSQIKELIDELGFRFDSDTNWIYPKGDDIHPSFNSLDEFRTFITINTSILTPILEKVLI